MQAAKCGQTLTCGILTAVIVGRQSRFTALAVIGYRNSYLVYCITCRGLTVTAVNDGSHDTREVGSMSAVNIGTCRGLSGLNR